VPSQQLDIARKGIEAYSRGDLGALLELVGGDVEFVVPDTMANSGRYIGRGSGIETQMWAAHLMRFDDGRLSAWRLCEAAEEAVRQVRDL
jgi:ketosteroid isomerase-like protein